MITQRDKNQIIKALRLVDAKKMDIDTPEKRLIKWFRFGSYSGILVAIEIINQWPVEKTKKVK